MIAGMAEAGEVVDLRWGQDRKGKSARFFDYIKTGKDGSFEVLLLGGQGWSELDLGLGKSVSKGKVNTSLTLYLANDDHGASWVYPGIAYGFEAGKLQGEGFLYHYLPINSKAVSITGGNPVIGLTYWVKPRWGVGGSLEAIRFQGASRFETKVGPSVRYGSRAKFLEVRIAQNSASDRRELQLRLFKAW